MRPITPKLQTIYDNTCICYGEFNGDIYEHIPTLRALTEECDLVTEMGVRWVVSTWAFLAGKPKKLISIDIDYHPDIEKVKKIAFENGISFEFIQGNTLQITIEETDLLFLDTLHTYTQLKKELTLHANKVRKYIIMHDTTTYAHCGMGPELGGDIIPLGLWNAITEFLAQNINWRIKARYTNNNGLTILEKS